MPAVFGLLLVALGVMFLLDSTHVLGGETEVFGTFWPVLLIAWGAWRLLSMGFRSPFWTIAILAVGVVFLLSNLDLWAWSIGQLWPILVVVIGLVFY